jgi:V/A-type H+-transporting ATPase subunit A
MIREFVLQQNAFHKVDTYCELKKQFILLNQIKKYSELAEKALALEVPVKDIAYLKSRDELAKLKFEEDFDGKLKAVSELMDKEFRDLEVSS